MPVTTTAYRGVIRGRTVILEEGAELPEGSEVLVTPLTAPPGSPQAILEAMRSEPHLRPEDVDELERHIEAGKRPVSFRSPFRKKRSGRKR